MQPAQQNDNSCSMIGLLGIFIQVALGVLSFSVLIIKRLREKPRRIWKIWIFDTSKQLLSQIFAHFINLTISISLAYSDTSSDQCLWYFITNILDNTLGVLMCILLLKGIQRSLCSRKKYEYISGNYYTIQKVKIHVQIMDQRGEVRQNIKVQKQIQLQKHQNDLSTEIEEHTPKKQMQEQRQNQINDSRIQTGDQHERQDTQIIDKINYKAWLVQLTIWICIVIIGKIIIFSIQFGLENPLKVFSFYALGWIEKYPILELILVIVIVPVIMNALAFWVQDNFLKKKEVLVPQGQNPLIEEHSERKQEQNDTL